MWWFRCEHVVAQLVRWAKLQRSIPGFDPGFPHCLMRVGRNCVTVKIDMKKNLMTRLSLKAVYQWRHVWSTTPPFILWWWNLKILFAPLNRSSPFIRESCAVELFKWNTLLYSREDPKRSLYCEMSLDMRRPFLSKNINKKILRYSTVLDILKSMYILSVVRSI
jgi:hypothetical protein